MNRVLITGGAGFVGSHVAAELLDAGYSVRALDNLTPQVHGEERTRPSYLNRDVELMVGDVRNPDDVERAFKGIDAVYHFAARVGVGQSMYQIGEYTSVNNYGTAVLLEGLLKARVQKLIVASSMSIYGEGMYVDPTGVLYSHCERTAAQLQAADWELRNEKGEVLKPVPTPETKRAAHTSIYALSKFDQERMCLAIGKTYNIPTVALRFFNIYGPHQALSNPYTGVLAICASRLLNGKPPLINEDGCQQRDFVSVYDVARACRLALERPEAENETFNIGSGRPCSIRSLAISMASYLGTRIAPEITGKYRAGDIRHCYADISRAQAVLGYKPQVELEEGLADLADWLPGQRAEDRLRESVHELTARGLMV